MRKDRFEVLEEILSENRWIVDTNKGIVVTSKGIARQKMTSGYYFLKTSFEGKEYNFAIHQIIAVAGGLNPVGKTINHKNGNKLDNRIENLEVISSRNNMKHAFKNRLIVQDGENSHFAKLTEKDVIEIKNRLRLGESQSSIAKRFGVFQTTISKINIGETWRNIS